MNHKTGILDEVVNCVKNLGVDGSKETYCSRLDYHDVSEKLPLSDIDARLSHFLSS